MFVVTGASSGIGHATAAALAERDIDVLAIARRGDLLQSLAERHGGRVQGLATDLSTAEGVTNLVDHMRDLGRIHGVVHAAGSPVPVTPYTELTPEELADHFRIHVAAPIEINNRLAETLRGGRVLYIDSYSAATPRVGWSGYSIVKAAAQMAARAAAEELEEVRVVRVFPGGVRTALVQAVLDSPTASPAVAAFRDLERDGKIADPHDIGRYLARLAIDADDELLAQREFWDYNDPSTHDLLS